MCALKFLFFHEFSSQTAAWCWVRSRTCYHARPQLIRAGRHEAWGGLAAHLLFEQVFAKVKILEFDANGPWRPLCVRFIAVT